MTTTPLPTDEDGHIITSADFGECWHVKIEWNTDSDGNEIAEDDWEKFDESVTFHGPFDTPQLAADWANAYPDDTDVREMTVQVMNRVSPRLVSHTTTEWGVERPDGESIEWGGSVGMTHNYPYTEENVEALSGGRAIYKRERTSYPDTVGRTVLVKEGKR